jgi:glycosyltransferase involved in cell wall biosynthesis
MKIWFFEIGEPLPIEPNVRLHRYGTLSKHLADLGHEVVWWTSSFSHAPKKHFVDEYTEMKFGDVDLKIIPGGGYRRNVSLERIGHYKHFVSHLKKHIIHHQAPDIIISPIPVIEIALESVNNPHLASSAVVVDIRDLWPDEFLNLVPNFMRPFAKLALTPKYSQLKQVCNKAAGITGVSKRFMDYGLKYRNVSANVPSKVMPIGYNIEVFPEEQRTKAAEKWGKLVDPNAFIVCFFGTIGRYFNFDTVISAAQNFKEQNINVQFILCGDGSSRTDYEKKAKGLPNVVFPGWVNGAEIAELMGQSDLGLAPYRTDAFMEMPNKPFEYFSGNLPVISSLCGEMAKLLEEHKCGKQYDAGSVDSLVSAIDFYRLQPDEKKMAGDNAKKLLLDRFTSDKIAKQWESFLVEVLNHSNMIAPSNDV